MISGQTTTGIIIILWCAHTPLYVWNYNRRTSQTRNYRSPTKNRTEDRRLLREPRTMHRCTIANNTDRRPPYRDRLKIAYCTTVSPTSLFYIILILCRQYGYYTHTHICIYIYKSRIRECLCV